MLLRQGTRGQMFAWSLWNEKEAPCAPLPSCFLRSWQARNLPHGNHRGTRAQLVNEATAICVRALEFAQGDRASLMDAQSQYSAEGWAQFMSKLEGRQDDKGAPVFTSHFRPSGPALDVRQHDGVVAMTLPGALDQESRNPYGGAYRLRGTAPKSTSRLPVQLAGSPA